MYQFLQTFHSHNRNLVLLVGVIVIVWSLALLLMKKPWGKANKIFSLIWMILIDVQCTIGLALYFIFSSLGIKAFTNPNVNVMQGDVRKIAVEHFVLMIAAWVLVHIGYSKLKKSTTPHKTLLIYYGIALALILAGIPWSKL